MTTTLNLNGQPVAVNAEPDTPLLWVLRGELQMNGTKFGCGMALCGACTVHLNGEPVRKMLVFDTASFFFMYFVTILACTLVVASAGQGVETALTATLATLGNIGPGLALVGPVANYGFLPDYVTWTLSFAMLVGRLELYTVFVLFSSAYRRS